jgi:putative DNA primase/helicase
MQERDLAMVHAYRGIGKSRFTQGIGVAAASGGQFLRFNAPLPKGVLIVDGELPREDLQKMLAQAVAASEAEPTAPLRILSADLSEAPVRSLATDAGRVQIERHLDGVSLLILDSITTLCPGAGPENDAESWEVMQSWLLELRRRGISVLLVHHEGKGGVQRGTSKREDVLSQVIQLKRPADYEASQGARFEMHFTKSRGLVGDAVTPIEVRLVEGPTGIDEWTWQLLEDAQAVRVKRLSDDGMNQREIAKDLGIGVGTVNRALKRSRNNG